jgi:uncharacterized membrane protein YciS (DUF1049 family)
VDVGLSTVTRMAREDTRWFVVGVVALAIVLFFALPLSVLIYVDMQKRLGMAEVRIERKLKKLDQLEKQIKEANEKSADPVKPSGSNGM